jgi:predicted DNA-binding protein (MmcQ/YjbR family)
MVTIDTCRQLAMALPEVKQAQHFDKEAFKIGGKIFATLNLAEQRACVKLSAIDQSVFCQFDKEVMYPVPNKWGTHGWTLINLKKVRKSMLLDALQTAYGEVASTASPKKKKEG